MYVHLVTTVLVAMVPSDRAVVLQIKSVYIMRSVSEHQQPQESIILIHFNPLFSLHMPATHCALPTAIVVLNATYMPGSPAVFILYKP